MGFREDKVKVLYSFGHQETAEMTLTTVIVTDTQAAYILYLLAVPQSEVTFHGKSAIFYHARLLRLAAIYCIVA